MLQHENKFKILITRWTILVWRFVLYRQRSQIQSIIFLTYECHSWYMKGAYSSTRLVRMRIRNPKRAGKKGRTFFKHHLLDSSTLPCPSHLKYIHVVHVLNCYLDWKTRVQKTAPTSSLPQSHVDSCLILWGRIRIVVYLSGAVGSWHYGCGNQSPQRRPLADHVFI